MQLKFEQIWQYKSHLEIYAPQKSEILMSMKDRYHFGVFNLWECSAIAVPRLTFNWLSEVIVHLEKRNKPGKYFHTSKSFSHRRIIIIIRIFYHHHYHYYYYENIFTRPNRFPTGGSFPRMHSRLGEDSIRGKGDIGNNSSQFGGFPVISSSFAKYPSAKWKTEVFNPFS